ncbi:phosphotransferase-like protein [Burkholderia ambifaria]|uniref:phosphotransferase-like protein n=1 Tax=Burkholderia ambifaria TaxID=152480 RepID=UPI001ABB3BB8
MTPTQILLLNGAGSSGKTSLARALQTRLGSAFLHVQMDMFLDMLPARYMNDPAGYLFLIRRGWQGCRIDTERAYCSTSHGGYATRDRCAGDPRKQSHRRRGSSWR